MLKTSFLPFPVGVLLVFCGVTLPVRAAYAQQSVAERSQALNEVFTDYWQDQLRYSPEEATAVGDNRYNDRWSDTSPAAAPATLLREQGFLKRLDAIDTAGLSEQEKLSAELLKKEFVQDQEGARFESWQMPFNQMQGPQIDVPEILAIMPLDDLRDYQNYIARLKAVPTLIQGVEESMTLGVQSGRVIPKLLCEKGLREVTELAADKPEDSPFALPLKKNMPASISAADAKRIRMQLRDVIAQTVQPAYAQFGKYLTVQYLPHTRTDLGIWSIPNGDAYYAYLIRTRTTTKETAAQIHQLGLDEVKRDEAEMLGIAKKLGYTDLKTFAAAIKNNPKLHPTSEQQLIDVYKGYLSGMKAKLPDYFGILPKAPLVVVPVPAFQAPSAAPAFYEAGTPDGKRPGQFFVNTYHFADRNLPFGESIAYHEGLPGHHLQISIQQELTDVPEFRKHLEFTAYVEGWGLYSERLGKDMGFYQDPYADYGRLNADIWRAIRLVVDTGVHSQHWSRQQMVDFFHDHSAVDESSVQAEVDRYIAWPAQALSYKLGQLKILELRQRAQQRLGAQFSFKAFHDQVLGSGALPLDVLERRVDAWIAAGGK